MIRPATSSDETAWLEIRNEQEARFWSGVKKEITPAEHAAWFRWALSNPAHVLRVAEAPGGKVVGYARFELGLVGTVSFGVAAPARGQGIGTDLLRVLDEAAEGTDVTLSAWVHPSNIPSIRAFMRTGYRRGGEPGYELLVKQ